MLGYQGTGLGCPVALLAGFPSKPRTCPVALLAGFPSKPRTVSSRSGNWSGGTCGCGEWGTRKEELGWRYRTRQGDGRSGGGEGGKGDYTVWLCISLTSRFTWYHKAKWHVYWCSEVLVLTGMKWLSAFVLLSSSHRVCSLRFDTVVYTVPSTVSRSTCWVTLNSLPNMLVGKL